MQGRACTNEIETQNHILTTCTTLHSDESTLITDSDLFNDANDNLEVVAQKLTSIMNTIRNITEHTNP